MPGVALEILSVNQPGREASVAGLAERGPLSILQDTAADDVWGKWAVTYRDVVVLDRENRRVAVYNLTQHDLGVAENYQAMRQILLDSLR